MVAALICATALIAGCAPEPAPSPTATSAFGSEDEAFAAAEETYRAYVDATNNIRLESPDTFQPVFALTTGTQHANDEKSLTTYHASKTTVTGESIIKLLAPATHNAGLTEVSLAACLDVSGVDVVSAEGESLVNPNRVDVQSLQVTLQADPSSTTKMLISLIEGRDGAPSC